MKRVWKDNGEWSANFDIVKETTEWLRVLQKYIEQNIGIFIHKILSHFLTLRPWSIFWQLLSSLTISLTILGESMGMSALIWCNHWKLFYFDLSSLIFNTLFWEFISFLILSLSLSHTGDGECVSEALWGCSRVGGHHGRGRVLSAHDKESKHNLGWWQE